MSTQRLLSATTSYCFPRSLEEAVDPPSRSTELLQVDVGRPRLSLRRAVFRWRNRKPAWSLDLRQCRATKPCCEPGCICIARFFAVCDIVKLTDAGMFVRRAAVTVARDSYLNGGQVDPGRTVLLNITSCFVELNLTIDRVSASIVSSCSTEQSRNRTNMAVSAAPPHVISAF